MSYRRRRTDGTSDLSEVKGPNSALTSFLRDHGITAELIQRRRDMGDGIEEEVEVAEATSGSTTATNVDDIDEEMEIRIAARRKRRRAKRDESDYTDSEDETADGERPEKEEKQILGPGQYAGCYKCGNEFKISTYSRKVKDSAGAVEGYLCRDCTQVILEQEKSKRSKALLARKKRKKLAEALLDKQDVNFPALQDLCIKLLVKYIDDVEAFGDIGTANMGKICRILCKNRLLTDNTLKLFLNPKLTHLTLWDCSKLTLTSMRTIAAFCPRLTSIDFTYPGRLNNNCFDYYTTQLKDLTSVHLDGAFLIGEAAWDKFFKSKGSQLESFSLRNSYRFDDNCLLSLVRNCPNLKELSLSKLDGIVKPDTYESIANLTKLKHLEISFPSNESLVPDETLLVICENIGYHLETLILDGCTALTDKFLMEAVGPFCVELKNLSLDMLDQITDAGVSSLFSEWSENSGLLSLNLHKCILLSTGSMIDVINHSHATLTELNINSLSELNRTFFEVMKDKGLPNLVALDCGFVRCVDNSVVHLIQDACPKLRILEVYGNNRCGTRIHEKKGLKIIGRQSDSI